MREQQPAAPAILQSQFVEALRDSEERFARFAEHLPGLCWIKDLEGHYVYVNDAATSAFGHPRDMILGRTDHDLFAPEMAATFRANDQLALADSTGIQVVERMIDPEGRVHESIVSKFPILGADGVPSRVGGIAVDITERVIAEEALRQTDRRRSEFLATLAHELRNPLAPIRNALHILRLGDVDGVNAKVHDILDQQVLRLVRLVDDLLEVSRITTGRIELRSEMIELGPVILSAIETNRAAIDAEGQQLSVTLPDRPMFIEGDPIRLAQVLSNLLNNASKYTLPRGNIRVTAWPDGSEACIAVRDDGLGIPTELLSRVFEMFTPIDSTLGRSQGGLGIGLALTRDLVELHGGHISVSSKGLNRGTEFLVRFPLAQPVEIAELLPSEPIAAQSISQRILVVDDNHDGADSLGMVLRLMGAETLVVYDGPSALLAIREYRPSVVLLDIGMPGMDGLEVAAIIRSDPELQRLRLIALTGWGSEDMRARVEAAGFDSHWVKPVDPEWLKGLSASPSPSAT